MARSTIIQFSLQRIIKTFKQIITIQEMAGSLLGGEAAHTQSPITATRCGGGSFTDAHLPRADKLYYGSYVGASILRSFGDSGWPAMTL